MIILPDGASLSPDYNYKKEIDGQMCSLRMIWNTRESAWFLTIQDGAGGRIDGIRVIANKPLLRQNRAQISISGDIIAASNQTNPTDPDYYSFSTTHALQYMTPQEIKDWGVLNGLG